MGTRIIIADDHPSVRRCLRRLLETQSDIKVVGEGENGEEAVERCRELSPHVALVDVHMPGLDGIGATRRIVRQFPRVKVLAVSADRDWHGVRGMLVAGASGYVLKDRVHEELTDAIYTIVKGGAYIGAKIKDDIIAGLCRGAEALTREERAVLRGLTEGKCLDDIALDLHLDCKKSPQIRRSLVDRIAASDLADLVMHILRGRTEPGRCSSVPPADNSVR